MGKKRGKGRRRVERERREEWKKRESNARNRTKERHLASLGNILIDTDKKKKSAKNNKVRIENITQKSTPYNKKRKSNHIEDNRPHTLCVFLSITIQVKGKHIFLSSSSFSAPSPSSFYFIFLLTNEQNDKNEERKRMLTTWNRNNQLNTPAFFLTFLSQTRTFPYVMPNNPPKRRIRIMIALEEMERRRWDELSRRTVGDLIQSTRDLEALAKMMLMQSQIKAAEVIHSHIAARAKRMHRALKFKEKSTAAIDIQVRKERKKEKKNEKNEGGGKEREMQIFVCEWKWK